MAVGYGTCRLVRGPRARRKNLTSWNRYGQHNKTSFIEESNDRQRPCLCPAKNEICISNSTLYSLQTAAAFTETILWRGTPCSGPWTNLLQYALNPGEHSISTLPFHLPASIPQRRYLARRQRILLCRTQYQLASSYTSSIFSPAIDPDVIPLFVQLTWLPLPVVLQVLQA